ncbi:peptidoglycan DD-metalloendopeptidase family protein [Ancylothrix sp. C2]|uniref:peptidoglycan DD-metalloendopeptidase family protein n=1 Tax=Ancylothrix sp. D3o TaxID=2953691 RepID=UPI0021BB61EA|nr:peptidoglycan DD-metalloendopeptidase family protein [Ancylothrix sp. D3o]MCT7952330.1 peptidoglycan DD-metalloendopeptidase family protein [Ancylothrix sp. D3o]
METVTPVLADPHPHSRTRTHYALIGLALSVGATSLFLPRQGDQANATEYIPPTGTQSAVHTSEVTATSAETQIQSLVSGPAAKKIESAPQNAIDAGVATATQNVNPTPDAEVMPVAIQQPETYNQSLQNNSSDSLRQEIIRLRQKYRRLKEQPQTHLSQTTSITEDQQDLQFRQTTQSVQLNLENLRRKRNLELQVRNSSLENPTNLQTNRQELIAVAPLGSEAYEYDIKPRFVSPALPPLNRPDTYLPKTPAIFEGYIWPAQGTLTSGYGWRWGRMHAGIDIAGPIGTPIVAAGGGIVTFAGWDEGGYGNLVEIQHPDGSITRYAHNNRILVREGQQVEGGQQIAEMGSTGNSTGPHLHFEIHPQGKGAENPLAYLRT